MVIIFFICLGIVVVPYTNKSNYSDLKNNYKGINTIATTTEITKKETIHIKTPDAVKAIYMTACVAGTPKWRTSLKKMINDTELNSVIIDIKDYSGTVAFIDPELQEENVPGCRVRDLREFIEELHKDNIYVIGRITVFQDPYYTKNHPDLAVRSKATGGVWKDHKGLAFIDVGAKPYWDYVINLSKKSYELGFDELNFDYIRYPSDGNMKDANYTLTIGTSTKSMMLKSFFAYLHNGLKDTGVKTSADLFGMTTTANDDLGIGQILEDTLPYFDFVAPMVYPSHYPPNWNGIKKPAASPYEVIKLSMQGGIDKINNASSTISKLRPWLQDFDLGADYNAPEVRAQMQAGYDLGINSWFMWNAGNKYTDGAYLPDASN